jgi:hypothetical protein
LTYYDRMLPVSTEAEEIERRPRAGSLASPRPGAGRRCVLLFAREAPQEARAKGMGRARPLFALSRRRIVSTVSSLPGVDLLVVTEGRPRGPQRRAVGGGGDPAPASGTRQLTQRGRTFAARLRNAFAEARALGYAQVVAVPTDVPALDRRQLVEAFRRLAAARVVLGPCPDGGVYLIGCRGPAAALLAGVRWQTPAVLADLAGNARRLGAAAFLGPLADVDSRADFQALLAAPALDRALAALVRVLLRHGRPVEDGGGRPSRLLVVAPRLAPRAPPVSPPR